MPHMAPAAIVALVIQVIQQVAPLIQQFLQSNQQNSDDFNQNKKDLKAYLDTLNDNLQKLDQQIEKATGKSFPITTNRIDSGEEARALAADLQALATEAESDPKSPLHDYVDQLKSQASTLRIAAMKLDSEGQTVDPDGTLYKNTLTPTSGSAVINPTSSFGSGYSIPPVQSPNGSFTTSPTSSNLKL
jgi:ABC-type transporter Mla subunit MlaD